MPRHRPLQPSVTSSPGSGAAARSTWSLFSICQSMLANSQSMAQVDVDRRNRVRQSVVDFNTQLAEVCAAYIHCRFDNNAVFNTVFTPSDVSTRDYFHPSLSGQARLAAASYEAGFDFTDATPPISWALTLVRIPPPVSSPGLPGILVALEAQDDVQVAGIEYKVDGGAYGRYSGPITVQHGSTLTYRAVDVNGNVEAAHALSP